MRKLPLFLGFVALAWQVSSPAAEDPHSTAQALGVTWRTWPSKLIFDATPTAKAISVQ